MNYYTEEDIREYLKSRGYADFRVDEIVGQIPSSFVHCKDCKYNEPYFFDTETNCCGIWSRIGLGDKFYCAFGERKA